eukprot:COSAG03_NODE_108_length_12558_cov_5.305081_1_plen_67_part_00
MHSDRSNLVHHGKTDVPVDTECTSTVCFPQFANFVCRAVQSLPTMNGTMAATMTRRTKVCDASARI